MNFISDSHRSSISRTILIVLIALAAFLIVLTYNALIGGPYAESADDQQNTITVSAEESVFAVPDTAEFTFSVQEIGDTVATAQQTVTETTNEILAYLEEAGIDEDDTQTVGYRVNPQYNYVERTNLVPPRSERVLAGYEVEHTISVRVEDTEQAGELLSGVGEREADSVSGLRFTVEDLDAVQASARGQAIEEAREKASILADQLGVSIVGVVSFSEGGNNRPFIMERSFATMDGDDAGISEQAAPDVPVGENEITSSVQITYEIR